MLQQCICRDIGHMGSLDSIQEDRELLLSAVPQATLMPLSCSPNFPHTQYLDIQMLMHELIVNFIIINKYIKIEITRSKTLNSNNILSHH